MKSKALKLIRRDEEIRLSNKWLLARYDHAPEEGWIRRTRKVLGLSTTKLAEILGIAQSNVTRMESREKEGKITLESLNKVAEAMDCKLVYALVPKDDCKSHLEIIEQRAESLAKKLIDKNKINMNLESQNNYDLKSKLMELRNRLMHKPDSRIWDVLSENK